MSLEPYETHFTATHLVRLRATCSMAKDIVDALPFWDDLLLHMDRMNRYNISPFDNMPFAWLPEAERDENYVERRAQLKGWSKIDPRIRPWGLAAASFDSDPDIDSIHPKGPFPSLKPFTQCGELYIFSKETVDCIKAHIPMAAETLRADAIANKLPWHEPPLDSGENSESDDESSDWSSSVPRYDCEPPAPLNPSPAVAETMSRISEVRHHRSSYTDDGSISERFAVFFRLAQLNTAMEDLQKGSGPEWYRDMGHSLRGQPRQGVGVTESGVIREARGSSLKEAICRFYCCDDVFHLTDPDLVQWMGGNWGTDLHLEYLAARRAASRELSQKLGERMCERIEVLGEARANIQEIMEHVRKVEKSWPRYSQSSSDSSLSDNEQSLDDWYDLDYAHSGY